jgi:hypothetical protein
MDLPKVDREMKTHVSGTFSLSRASSPVMSAPCSPTAHLQHLDEEVQIHDSCPSQASLALHRAEEKGRGEDHSQKHLDKDLELSLQIPSSLAVFKAPFTQGKTLTSN